MTMNADREALLKQVTALDFAAVDLQLYLNTHPHDTDALEMYNDCTENARRARKTYEQQFGPLTGFRSEGQTDWSWENEPWPWQAEFNFSPGGHHNVGL
ncbi:MAG: spore coat protein CotJB [Clostridiales bacterium]|jgi:spore coat protein JB|nr:spore coat protein CotJB [Clostridiales bacterium]